MSEIEVTPSQELALEVLAARYRLGEKLWTFTSRQRRTLDQLAALGYVYLMHGVSERSVRAGLTEQGKKAVLFPGYRVETWICPHCGTGWIRRPLISSAVGCPECGNYEEVHA